MAETNVNIIVTVEGTDTAAVKVEGVSTAVRGVGTASEETSKSTGGLGRSLKGLATGIAVFKAYSFVKGAISDTVDLAKSTAGLQRITGMDAQTAGGWVAIAKERGLASKQLNQGFITLSRQMVAATGGSKTTAKAFEQLGISQGSLGKMNTQQTLGAVSDALAKLPPGAERSAAAQKLFGRSAQALLPLLTQGSHALNEQVGAMGKQVGMSKESEKSGLALAKQQREMESTMLGLKVAIATALLPILQALLAVFTPIIQAFSELMQSSLAFRIIVVGLVAALTTWVVAGQLLALTGLEVNSAWLLIPTLIIGIGVALVMLYQKCAWFRDAVNAVWAAIKVAFNAVLDAIKVAWNWVKNNWPLLLGILTGPFGLMVGLIIQHWDTVKAALKAGFDWLTGAIQAVAGVITGAFGGAWRTVKGVIDGVVNSIRKVIDTAKGIVGLPGKAEHAVAHFLGFGQHGLVAPPGGGYAVVGEAGPELVSLPGGARVIPNAASAGGGGGRVIVPVYLDRRQIALAFGDYTAEQQARR